MRNVRAGSLLGIPILISPSTFLLLGWITIVFAYTLYPDTYEDAGIATYVIMAAINAPLFFLSIILHELAHSAVARAYKIPVRSITLFALGGVAQITRDAGKPLPELIMAIAGPFTSLVIGAAFLGAWALMGGNFNSPADSVVFWLGFMNVLLAVFNMLPAFPMDGGRVFRSVLWLITRSYYRSTLVAGWTGRGLAWAMMLAGVLALLQFDVYVANSPLGGFWLLLIGFFLESVARQSLLQNRLMNTLGRYNAGDLMTSDPPVVEATISVAALARGVLDLNPRVCYFVESEGKLAGILSGYQMRAVPEPQWDTTTAAEAMVPSAKLKATPPDRPVSDVLLEMETENLTHMPVVAEGRVVGVIGRDRIIGVLRQAGLLGGAES